MRPRCPSVGPNGYRCRKRAHGPVPAEPLPPLEVCHVAYGWQGADYWDDETAMEPPSQHVSIGDEDIVWDVDRLIAAAAAKAPRPVRAVDFVDPEAVNPRHWRSVDIHTPIILIPHPFDGRPVVIDGRHRLMKAYHLGREFVPSVMLSRAEEQRCRMTPDEREHLERMYAAQERFMAGHR